MRPRKTPPEILAAKSKRRRRLDDLRLNTSIEELIGYITDTSANIEDLLNETDCLAILNKAKINNFVNCYITRIFDSAEGTQALNKRLLQKIIKKKEIIPPEEYAKVYLKSRELENDQLRLITELMKTQDVKLDIEEQNMIIIYRSLPISLKKFMYKTVMEFIRKCPAIQRELQKENQKQLKNQQ